MEPQTLLEITEEWQRLVMERSGMETRHAKERAEMQKKETALQSKFHKLTIASLRKP